MPSDRSSAAASQSLYVICSRPSLCAWISASLMTVLMRIGVHSIESVIIISRSRSGEWAFFDR